MSQPGQQPEVIHKKVCLLGAFAVGKTSLVRRYVESIFDKRYQTTLGVKVDKKSLRLEDSVMTLVLWDLAGKDQFAGLRVALVGPRKVEPLPGDEVWPGVGASGRFGAAQA